MAASPLSFAGEFRLFFNPRSGRKLQDDVRHQLIAIDRMSMRIQSSAQRRIIEGHRKTVREIEEINRESQAKLDSQSAIIAKRIAARSKGFMMATYPKAQPAPKGMESYANAYTASIARMRAANKLYISEANRLGISAKMGPGGRFGTEAFGSNDIQARVKGISVLNELIKKNKTLENELRYLRNDALRQNEQLTASEREHQAVIRQGAITIKTSANLTKQTLREVELVIRRMNQALKEQAMLYMQMGQETLMNFKNAVMMSGVAIMMLGFRLHTTTEEFKAFENELINAQSIFQTSQETLYSLSDEIVEFGQKFGIAMGKASEGLYQLASAGLSAEESIMVLTNTLKLAMAVQGDHNTIAKLTTQVIFGFGMQMSDSAILTDKFAHAINKSLIEYQDLASAVKFAMPFFITTGQSIDQLLGSLEILTNRALEAGIAGRGLRQALAEFAQHADDNTAAFAKLGVEITDSSGNFLQLTQIAKNFQIAMGEMSNDTELLTTLLEDLNVRGATAFVHLVQNADEFQEAVDDLSNSAGSATEMAAIQQQSLANQIQRLKNILAGPFLMSDSLGNATNTLNEFGQTVHSILNAMEEFVGENEFGEYIKDFIIVTMEEFYKIGVLVAETIYSISEGGRDFGAVLSVVTVPLKIILKVLKLFGDGFMEAYIAIKMVNGILPANIALTYAQTQALQKEIVMTQTSTVSKIDWMTATESQIQSEEELAIAFNKSTQAMGVMIVAQMAASILMFGMIMYTQKYAKDSPLAAAGIGVIAGALIGLAFAFNLAAAAKKEFTFGGLLSGSQIAWALGMGAAMGAIYNVLMQQLMKPQVGDIPVFDNTELMETSMAVPGTFKDLGGRIMYDTGGYAGLGNRHRAVMVEPGETIIPKTQNMMGSSGITLNIQGDVYDGDNFAEKIGEALPYALRMQSDIGAI